MRVLVVGGGVMGCATALALAERGVREVVVLERAVPGAEASSAAAGMLAAQLESKNEAELDAFVRARAEYGPWAARLREATGIDIGHRRSGILALARDEEGLARMRATVAAQAARGLAAELVDPSRARAIEPELSPSIAGAAYYPDEAQVDPPQLLRALVVAIARAGVVTKSGTTVSTLLTEGGRCVGVSIDGREVLRADAVVLAAGSWSSLVPGMPADLPRVRPVRGQLVLLEERPPRLGTIVFDGHSYVVPRGDGRVICGSTMEDVGHRREVTAAGVHAILGAALRVAPRLAEAEMTRAWCNFRPSVAGDGAPLVGASPLPGLFLATGHHRNGILLANASSTAVAMAVLATK
ncbi:MAG: glycine oxidase ThiO [Deltaproteobacteria bacterium]|nr:glycine oxidase ThiO [Deltaproteobacteria bacterium]